MASSPHHHLDERAARVCVAHDHGAGRHCRYETTADGTRLHVVEAGEQGSTRGIVFVHGFVQSHLVFDEQLRRPHRLPGRRLVSFDLRGHGWSSGGAGGYDDPAAWADDLRTVVEGAGLDEVVLVAWSYGGFVVGDFLAAGGSAAGLVLVAAGSSMAPVDDDVVADGFLGLIPALRSPKLEASLPATRELVAMLTAEPLDAEATLRLEGASARAGAAARRGLSTRAHDVRAALAGCGAPTLVVHGARDRLVDLSASRSLADASGAELVVVDDTGHMPFFERPDAFDDVLRAFLASIDDRRAASHPPGQHSSR